MRSAAGPITSRAVTYRGLGGPEVIQLVEREVPPPGANEVRIEVVAAAVNPTDLLLRDPAVRSALVPAHAAEGLVIPGTDAAGIIESVGPGVTRLRPGDEVMAAVKARRPEGGAQARHIVVPAASVVPIPSGASMSRAATLPMNGLTALRAIELAAAAGTVLAVTGGAGLLAGFAMAVARRHGMRILADARPADAARVRKRGADVVVDREEDFAAAIRREVPGGADALLDTAVLGERSLGALRDGGTYVPVRGWNGPIERGIQVAPVLVYDVLERTAWLEVLRDMVTSGEIELPVAQEYPPEETAAAQRALAAGGLQGRPVIRFG